MKILSMSPLRLGLGGGGTDIKEFYEKNEGVCINITISLYARAFISKLKSKKIEIEILDLKKKWIGNSVQELKKVNVFRLIYGPLALFENQNNLKIKNLSIKTLIDVPPGSGMGSSSALVVALLSVLYKIYNIKILKSDLANQAYKAERVYSNIAGGKQDQYAAVYGGLNFFTFKKNNKVLRQKMLINQEIENFFHSNITIFCIKISRNGSDIINDQKKFIKKTSSKINSLNLIKKSAFEIKKYIENEKFNNISSIIRKSWKEKKKTSNLISNRIIDNLEKNLFKIGANALKVSGAGGGGFLLIVSKPDVKLKIMDYLKKTDTGDIYFFKLEKKGVQTFFT